MSQIKLNQVMDLLNKARARDKRRIQVKLDPGFKIAYDELQGAIMELFFTDELGNERCEEFYLNGFAEQGSPQSAHFRTNRIREAQDALGAVVKLQVECYDDQEQLLTVVGQDVAFRTCNDGALTNTEDVELAIVRSGDTHHLRIGGQVVRFSQQTYLEIGTDPQGNPFKVRFLKGSLRFYPEKKV